METAPPNILCSPFTIIYFCGDAINALVWNYLALGKEELQILGRMVHYHYSEKNNKKKVELGN